jgi:hypothetical protein
MRKNTPVRHPHLQPLEPRLLFTRTLFVDAYAPGATQNGSSWKTAYRDLHLALAAAKPGDTIRVADGEYQTSTTDDRAATFRLKDAVAIRGSFAGYAAKNPNARDVTRFPTFLTGEGSNSRHKVDNAYHVITAIDVGPSTVLDGLTICDGSAGGGDGIYAGGGLLATRSTLTLRNVTFDSNQAGAVQISGTTELSGPVSPSTGGALSLADNSFATLVGCSFGSNSAWAGGAIAVTDSSATLIGCTFLYNSAGAGGAVSVVRGALSVTDSTFTNNHVSEFGPALGGALHAVDATLTIRGGTFTGNSASAIGTSEVGHDVRAAGGAISADRTAVQITDTAFTANFAIWWRDGKHVGGALFTRDCPDVTVTRSSFTGNYAEGHHASGGAIYNLNSPLTVSNSTFRANHLKRSSVLGIIDPSIGGGAIWTDASAATPQILGSVFVANGVLEDVAAGGAIRATGNLLVANSSFVANFVHPPDANSVNSPGAGGAIFSDSGIVTLSNSILSKNYAPNAEQLSIPPASVVTRNHIAGGYPGSDLGPYLNSYFEIDPGFLRNPSPGPDATWLTPDDNYGDLHLRPASPLVDQGDPALLPPSLTTDIDGQPRTVRSVPDLGADEVADFPLVTETGTANPASPDLAVTAVRLTSLDRNARRITGTVTIRNTGSLPTAGRRTLKLYLSTDSLLSTSDTLRPTLTTRPLTLRPGQSATVRFTLTLPPRLASTRLRILPYLVPSATTQERETLNNVFASNPFLLQPTR